MGIFHARVDKKSEIRFAVSQMLSSGLPFRRVSQINPFAFAKYVAS